MKVGIIGGSGIYEALESIRNRTERTLETPYGIVTYIEGVLDVVNLIFIPRHGKGHRLPLHKVNYKGNIWAMNALGVERIISTSAVGSLRTEYRPGDMVIPNQYLDFTKEIHTFSDDADEVIHADLSIPFCPILSALLYRKWTEIGDMRNMEYKVHLGGTYACMSGPAFETKAEIKMLQKLDTDIVGMTVVPECKLAREKQICYGTLSIVVNWAAGFKEGGNTRQITHEETLAQVEKMKNHIAELLYRTILAIPSKRECICSGV